MNIVIPTTQNAMISKIYFKFTSVILPCARNGTFPTAKAVIVLLVDPYRKANPLSSQKRPDPFPAYRSYNLVITTVALLPFVT